MELKEKYKAIFNISEDDYQKAKLAYDKYLNIFDDLLIENSFNKKKLKERIESENPWLNSGYFKDNYSFNSLAGSDYHILGDLLKENIKTLEKARKKDAKNIVEARFNDFEQAFDGNFINPQVILLGINPKMASNHSSYGLKDTIYIHPFKETHPVLYHKDIHQQEDKFKNDYYFKKGGFFYTNEVPENIRIKHINFSTKKEYITPFALLEVFPYASENEREWQKGYKISSSIRKYFQLKKVLPSQIWLICLLTYAIKNSENLILYLRINRAQFRNNFLEEYFKRLDIKANNRIEVLTKKSYSNQVLSRGNIKPYFKENTTKVRTDSVENFFKDIWNI
jgi:hypothetical protein